MNRLESALARLTAALDSLESGGVDRLSAGARSHAVQVEILQAERDRLAARIAGLEEESRTLADLTDEVETRLDGAIMEIREALIRN